MSVSSLPVGSLLSVQESLRVLAESDVAKGASQCIVVLMSPGEVKIEGAPLNIRAFGAGTDSDRAHMLLGIAIRQLEGWFTEAL